MKRVLSVLQFDHGHRSSDLLIEYAGLITVPVAYNCYAKASEAAKAAMAFFVWEKFLSGKGSMQIDAVLGTLTIFSHRMTVVRVLGSKFLLYHFGIKAVII